MAEKSASAPLYALLKREDEKHVTEQAYENPVFVEDLVSKCVPSVSKQTIEYPLTESRPSTTRVFTLTTPLPSFRVRTGTEFRA